jgi:hypothetical protein
MKYLKDINPYLNTPEKRRLATAMAVKSSNDIDGIHYPLEYYLKLYDEANNGTNYPQQ